MTTLEKLVELIKETSSKLPDDVIGAIRAGSRRESSGSSAKVVLDTILDNCRLAADKSVPLCQDTGTLTFFVDWRLSKKVTPEVLAKAVALATQSGYLRCNTIDSITGKSYDDNCAVGAPVVHYVQSDKARPSVTLLMKGGGSENMSRQYSLPDQELGAGRDMQGVEKCVIDAVEKIQGYGCAPGILGICIGGDRASGFEAAKEQLLRPLTEKPSALERKLLNQANALGIGPMGLGGKTTLLGVKVTARSRLPASFFVTIAYMCWAARRRTLEF